MECIDCIKVCDQLEVSSIHFGCDTYFHSVWPVGN
jgi:hypothetical protein